PVGFSLPFCMNAKEKEKGILAMRKEGKTLAEVAKAFGVTRERVRQTEIKYSENYLNNLQKMNEQNICAFCKESKIVQRFYVEVRAKHFDDNKGGRYSNFFYYCSDCGIKCRATEKLVALFEEYKTETFPTDFVFKLVEIIHPDIEMSKYPGHLVV
ncbi:MAG: sigma factor-like helix-turn-helix DNA-binding protein, partial [Minisyncoccia bacterium]